MQNSQKQKDSLESVPRWLKKVPPSIRRFGGRQRLSARFEKVTWI